MLQAVPTSLRLSCMVAAVVDGGDAATVTEDDAAWLVNIAFCAEPAAAADAESAWGVLATLCGTGMTSTNRTRLTDAEAFDVASMTLRRCSDNVGVVVACLRAVAALCGTGADKECDDHVCDAAGSGLVEAILEVLTRAVGLADVAAYGCLALSRLAYGSVECAMAVIADLGAGVNAVLVAMRRHSDVADVQRYGCAVLGKVDVFDAYVEDCVVDAVLAAMERHPDDAGVQEEGAAAIGRRNLKDLSTTAEVIIDAVLAAMRRHVDAARVQEECCYALATVALEKGSSSIIAAGGFEAVLAAMQRHGTAAGVQEQGCSALSRLSLVTAGARGGAAIDTVVAAMRQHPDARDVQFEACDALANRVGDSIATRAAVSSTGAIAAVMEAMRGHADEPLVQKSACAALQRIVGGDAGGGTVDAAARRLMASQLAEVASAGGVHAVLAAMRRHSDQDGAAAVEVLYRLALSDPACKAAIVNAGGVELVLGVVRRRASGSSGALRCADDLLRLLR